MTGSAVKEARLKASKGEKIIINSASSTTYLEVTKNSKFDSEYNSALSCKQKQVFFRL